MKRKTIAVCVTGFDPEYESKVILGISSRCNELDINLLIFANLMRKPELNSGTVLPESVVNGEIEIFKLINYKLINGIIMLGDSILDESVIYEVADKARGNNIPMVNINDEKHKVCKNVILSDFDAMEKMCRHLVDDHGFTRINFISGFKNNLQSDERLSAYKKVLTEHNIPIEESRIGYGEFWRKAYDVTAEFMKHRENKPQAIVCANDTMAFFCMDYLKEHGYRIPDEIVVTGFDAIKDSQIYSPALTTVRRAFAESGAEAVNLIIKMAEGGKVAEETLVPSVIVKSQSCGCVPINSSHFIDFYKVRYSDLNKFHEFNRYILDLNTSFSSAEVSNEMYSSLTRGAKFFHLLQLYVCICADVEHNSNSIEKYDIHNGYKGISENMISMFKYGHDIDVGAQFAVSELIPRLKLDGEKAVIYAFSPLYFKTRFLGYAAYMPSEMMGVGDLFGTWLMAISTNAGSFYMNNELEYVVDELDNLYIRDALTGLYNRRGMNRLGGKLVENAKNGCKTVSVICADLDRLKSINDTYGHEAGDNAIKQVAKAFESATEYFSSKAECVCTRTGGDEYCVILSSDSEDAVAEFVSVAEKYLDEYNLASGLPYKVNCSCGHFTICSKKIISLEQMIKIADENMYRVKSDKRKTIQD